MASLNPIGVGFIDVNAEGLFHFERLLLRDEFRCVAGWDAARELSKATHGRLLANAASPDDVIRHPEISLVWIGPDAPASLIIATLAAGKHVLMGLPAGVSSGAWRDWAGSESRICVAALHRWDAAFQMIRLVMTESGLGRVVNVRRYSRQYVPDLNSDRAGGASRSLRQKWFEILDELLLLIPDPVASITAMWNSESSDFTRGRAIAVKFATGCVALLELDRRSFAPVESGWMIDGVEGGFADGRRFVGGADRELIDVTVAELLTDQNALYDAVLKTVRDGAEFPVTPESMQRVLELMEMIDAL